MESSSSETTRRYRWPWVAGAAVVLFIALAVFWMTQAVRKLERERAVDAPLPTVAPQR